MRMAGPLPVSLVVITRDAAADIAECLSSASICADALVVDSGSGDHTVETARRSRCARAVARVARVRTAKAVRGAGSGRTIGCCASTPTSACRRYSAKRSARCSRTAIRAHAAYAFARRNRFLGRWLAHGEGYPDWTTRLFDRRRARWSDDPVHERVIADGPVGAARRRPASRVGGIARALRRQAESLHDAAGRGVARARRTQLRARGGRGAARAFRPVLRAEARDFSTALPDSSHIAIGCSSRAF